MISAIIFDADGVIFDNEDLWDKGQTEFLGRRGVIYNRALTKHLLMGRASIDGVKIMQEQYGFNGDPETLAKERIKIMEGLYQKAGLMPGFLNFYNTIKGQYKTAVATGSNINLFKILDQKFGITTLFGGKVYFVRDINNPSKTKLDIFLHAAKNLGTEPKECLVIEDAPLGIAAAKAANMKVVGLMSSYGKDMLSSADQIVESFEQIDLSKF